MVTTVTLWFLSLDHFDSCSASLSLTSAAASCTSTTTRMISRSTSPPRNSAAGRNITARSDRTYPFRCDDDGPCSGRFCSMVKELISDGSGNAVELEGEGDGDTLEVAKAIRFKCPNVSGPSETPVRMLFPFTSQYEYDYNENGDRVVLGRGTYGVVYAGRDLSNQVRIAIKEIPERDSRYERLLFVCVCLCVGGASWVLHRAVLL